MKALRIQLKQPSPNWLDYTLRQITCFTKKVDVTAASEGRPQTSQSSTGVADPFGSFKQKLKSTMQRNTQQQATQVVHKETGVPQTQQYIEDVKRVELSYLFNV